MMQRFFDPLYILYTYLLHEKLSKTQIVSHAHAVAFQVLDLVKDHLHFFFSLSMGLLTYQISEIHIQIP